MTELVWMFIVISQYAVVSTDVSIDNQKIPAATKFLELLHHDAWRVVHCFLETPNAHVQRTLTSGRYFARIRINQPFELYNFDFTAIERMCFSRFNLHGITRTARDAISLFFLYERNEKVVLIQNNDLPPQTLHRMLVESLRVQVRPREDGFPALKSLQL